MRRFIPTVHFSIKLKYCLGEKRNNGWLGLIPLVSIASDSSSKSALDAGIQDDYSGSACMHSVQMVITPFPRSYISHYRCFSSGWVFTYICLPLFWMCCFILYCINRGRRVMISYGLKPFLGSQATPCFSIHYTYIVNPFACGF